jgi:probable HAF family extracellular repeat protein
MKPALSLHSFSPQPPFGARAQEPGRWRRIARAGGVFMLMTTGMALTAEAWQALVAIDLGILEGAAESFPLDVSENGVAVGYSGANAFRWTRESDMTNLGTLGGSTSVASAVNDRGSVIVGSSSTAGDAFQHAFVWTENAGMVDIGTLGRRFSGSHATGVNNDALVIGFSWKDTPDFATRGFARTPAGRMINLGTFGGDTYPNAVNNRGMVVGTSYTYGNAESRPFAWTRAGGMVDLGSLGGPFGEAVAVSESGVVVGYSYTAGDISYSHPFVWTRETGMMDLGVLGDGNSGVATAVNDDGVVVGYTTTDGSAMTRAFLWTREGGMVALNPVDGRDSFARGVSADGLVVGSTLTADGGGLHGFAWTASGGMVDLDPLGGWSYSQVNSVTRKGLVFGFSYAPGGAGHATIWNGRRRPCRSQDLDDQGDRCRS